jgi:N-formylglutamate deformylase
VTRNPPFRIYAPHKNEAPIPVVIDLPNCGKQYPKHFNFCVEMEALRSFEDGHVDLMFLGAVKLGANVLVAKVARSYVDCNQDARQVNPNMFSMPHGIAALALGS